MLEGMDDATDVVCDIWIVDEAPREIVGTAGWKEELTNTCSDSELDVLG